MSARVHHVVLLKLKETSDVVMLMNELRGLQSFVPGLLSFSGGPNTSAEGLSRGFTHGFHMVFSSPAARDAYLPHPEHERVKALILANLVDACVCALPPLAALAPCSPTHRPPAQQRPRAGVRGRLQRIARDRLGGRG